MANRKPTEVLILTAPVHKFFLIKFTKLVIAGIGTAVVMVVAAITFLVLYVCGVFLGGDHKGTKKCRASQRRRGCQDASWW